MCQPYGPAHVYDEKIHNRNAFQGKQIKYVEHIVHPNLAHASCLKQASAGPSACCRILVDVPSRGSGCNSYWYSIGTVIFLSVPGSTAVQQ